MPQAEEALTLDALPQRNISNFSSNSYEVLGSTCFKGRGNALRYEVYGFVIGTKELLLLQQVQIQRQVSIWLWHSPRKRLLSRVSHYVQDKCHLEVLTVTLWDHSDTDKKTGTRRVTVAQLRVPRSVTSLTHWDKSVRPSQPAPVWWCSIGSSDRSVTGWFWSLGLLSLWTKSHLI